MDQMRDVPGGPVVLECSEKRIRQPFLFKAQQGDSDVRESETPSSTTTPQNPEKNKPQDEENQRRLGGTDSITSSLCNKYRRYSPLEFSIHRNPKTNADLRKTLTKDQPPEQTPTPVLDSGSEDTQVLSIRRGDPNSVPWKPLSTRARKLMPGGACNSKATSMNNAQCSLRLVKFDSCAKSQDSNSDVKTLVTCSSLSLSPRESKQKVETIFQFSELPSEKSRSERTELEVERKRTKRSERKEHGTRKLKNSRRSFLRGAGNVLDKEVIEIEEDVDECSDENNKWGRLRRLDQAQDYRKTKLKFFRDLDNGECMEQKPRWWNCRPDTTWERESKANHEFNTFKSKCNKRLEKTRKSNSTWWKCEMEPNEGNNKKSAPDPCNENLPQSFWYKTEASKKCSDVKEEECECECECECEEENEVFYGKCKYFGYDNYSGASCKKAVVKKAGKCPRYWEEEPEEETDDEVEEEKLDDEEEGQEEEENEEYTYQDPSEFLREERRSSKEFYNPADPAEFLRDEKRTSKENYYSKIPMKYYFDEEYDETECQNTAGEKVKVVVMPERVIQELWMKSQRDTSQIANSTCTFFQNLMKILDRDKRARSKPFKWNRCNLEIERVSCPETFCDGDKGNGNICEFVPATPPQSQCNGQNSTAMRRYDFPMTAPPQNGLQSCPPSPFNLFRNFYDARCDEKDQSCDKQEKDEKSPLRALLSKQCCHSTSRNNLWPSKPTHQKTCDCCQTSPPDPCKYGRPVTDLPSLASFMACPSPLVNSGTAYDSLLEKVSVEDEDYFPTSDCKPSPTPNPSSVPGMGLMYLNLLDLKSKMSTASDTPYVPVRYTTAGINSFSETLSPNAQQEQTQPSARKETASKCMGTTTTVCNASSQCSRPCSHERRTKKSDGEGFEFMQSPFSWLFGRDTTGCRTQPLESGYNIEKSDENFPKYPPFSLFRNLKKKSLLSGGKRTLRLVKAENNSVRRTPSLMSLSGGSRAGAIVISQVSPRKKGVHRGRGAKKKGRSVRFSLPVGTRKRARKKRQNSQPSLPVGAPPLISTTTSID
ncbi:unnamed protein product [Cyprideis torosa]|uniref:Uncharacterized protein n=1 Tax=Cyprideis torosa TaxID=163714 RepID=A0A7R8WF15_9CRUS|nr:unnamed protein product [Cyprideis torosa]CAG0891387.1 unnamed protein product [Cyprideis torosa]